MFPPNDDAIPPDDPWLERELDEEWREDQPDEAEEYDE